jgi:hypothetical protein
MKKYAILRHGKTKFKSMSQISSADAHNQREMQVDNADGSNNFKRLLGGKSSAETLKSLLTQYDIKPRKNAALAMEYVLTYSPEMAGKIDLRTWVAKNIEFLKKEHGVGVLSIDLHLDESTPHIQAICAPFIEKTVRGKMQMRLSGIDFWKGKHSLSSRQDRYAEAMNEFGLERGIKGSKAHHKTIKTFYKELDEQIKKAQKVGQNTYKEMGEFEGSRWKKMFADIKVKVRSVVQRLSLATGRIDDLTQRNEVLRKQMHYLKHQIDHGEEDKLEIQVHELEEEVSKQKELNTRIISETSDLIAIKDDRINVLENFIDKRQNSELKNDLEIDKSFKI